MLESSMMCGWSGAHDCAEGTSGRYRERLTHPLVRHRDKLRQASWDEALDAVVRRSKALLRRRSGSAFGFYSTRQLLLEEYYTLDVLSRAGLGTPHVDATTSLCTATTSAAMQNVPRYALPGLLEGALPGARHWDDPLSIQELARLWNVELGRMPHESEPTHAMQILRYAEQGLVKLLWVIGTNPAVSLPDVSRTHKILQQKGLFLVVQDAFMTETTPYADVVLPTAIEGEKTGYLVDMQRALHVSYQVSEPPGEARADLAILLDYARRMSFRDKNDAPLVKWSDPAGALASWKECARDCSYDYTDVNYAEPVMFERVACGRDMTGVGAL
ncbi:MAG TPA: molybdopterin-dependent oxidoreductase [Ktedonobacteraceae bacterium]|nr:molybdopterin-dependent oxidoreductase [Ktedonobacteraceae bacterium]